MATGRAACPLDDISGVGRTGSSGGSHSGEQEDRADRGAAREGAWEQLMEEQFPARMREGVLHTAAVLVPTRVSPPRPRTPPPAHPACETRPNARSSAPGSSPPADRQPRSTARSTTRPGRVRWARALRRLSRAAAPAALCVRLGCRRVHRWRARHARSRRGSGTGPG
eukprot:scaffold1619_cov121-Isochrysis_galbana.AAC.1